MKSRSPYADAILAALESESPLSIDEIRERIAAPEGAGISQAVRALMWSLAMDKDPRKIIAIRNGRHFTYRIVPRWSADRP